MTKIIKAYYTCPDPDCRYSWITNWKDYSESDDCPMCEANVVPSSDVIIPIHIHVRYGEVKP